MMRNEEREKRENRVVAMDREREREREREKGMKPSRTTH